MSGTENGGRSGAVLITQGASQLYARAYGYASRAWLVPNNLDTRFDTASITKLFTAVATLQLIDQGLLAFETPVVERLHLEGTLLSTDATVFHLLTHTSGIGDDADEEAGERYEDLWKEKPNYSVIETRDFLPQFVNKPANFPPGEGCRYCNCGYTLLGLLIESISGMTYRDYVRAHIFTEAEMTASDFFRLDRVNHNVAEGCDPIRDATGTVVGWKRNNLFLPADRVAGWWRLCHGRRPGPILAGGDGGQATFARTDRRVPLAPSGALDERHLDGDVRVRVTVLR
jgi:CubicO group peptidase (beta-lactamase class C family)